MKFTITSGGGYDLPVGIHHATFTGVQNETTQKGDAVRWCFHTDSGKDVSYFSDAKATTKNKTGRWLCALATRPITEGEVNAADYIGKKYLLVIADKEGGGTTLNTFSAIPAA